MLRIGGREENLRFEREREIIANNKYVCIYMLREQRFTSRSMVVCRVGGVPYWPCGGGR